MSLMTRGLLNAGVVLLALGLLNSPALAGDDPVFCDCSCSGYKELISWIDSRPTSAANLIDQCGASCANAWAVCEASDSGRLNGDPPATTNPSESQALGELLTRFLDGASSGDVAMHERFWADDLVYTSSAGQRYGKPELLAGLSSSQAETAPALVYSAEQVRIRFYDQLALLDFTLVATAEDDSQQRFLNSGVFKRNAGQWRAVNWQATRKAKP
jgi:hypothetical protein